MNTDEYRQKIINQRVLASIESAWTKQLYAPLMIVNKPLAQGLQETIHLEGEELGHYIMGIYEELLKNTTAFSTQFNDVRTLRMWYKENLRNYQLAKSKIQ